MAKRADRTRWVSYLGVSTVEQAEKEMSQTAQRRAEEEFAARHDAVIDRHYVEPGASGTDMHRIVWNELLGDALRPGSTTAVIVVHHTSRFTLDATHARVVKKELRRAGVRVLSVTQELTEDPMGSLMQSFFERIDQYQSEVNGQRTAATEGIVSSPSNTPRCCDYALRTAAGGVGQAVRFDLSRALETGAADAVPTELRQLTAVDRFRQHRPRQSSAALPR